MLLRIHHWSSNRHAPTTKVSMQVYNVYGAGGKRNSNCSLNAVGITAAIRTFNKT